MRLTLHSNTSTSITTLGSSTLNTKCFNVQVFHNWSPGSFSGCFQTFFPLHCWKDSILWRYICCQGRFSKHLKHRGCCRNVSTLRFSVLFLVTSVEHCSKQTLDLILLVIKAVPCLRGKITVLSAGALSNAEPQTAGMHTDIDCFQFESKSCWAPTGGLV